MAKTIITLQGHFAGRFENLAEDYFEIGDYWLTFCLLRKKDNYGELYYIFEKNYNAFMFAEMGRLSKKTFMQMMYQMQEYGFLKSWIENILKERASNENHIADDK